MKGGGDVSLRFDGNVKLPAVHNASTALGEGVSRTSTYVSAGNTLTLELGGNTNLKGTVANVGGDLNIESLQDTSPYHTKDQSIGGSVMVDYGFSGSANFSQQKIDSDFVG
ncbi:hemagglutinin repeat-containing protein [Ralstonia solanacearum]|uniref:Hemagglutinin repeat-containing protein n=1 Tax=Ralstonia solanacearum TaxID=305 RepID=A0AAW5ZRE9_RALSL|nr:hemagglutinin repeat-containing protein [Ralstonia solanacearum]